MVVVLKIEAITTEGRLKKWRSAQHQFVATTHRRPQQPVQHVDTATAEVTAIAEGTQAPPIHRIRRPGQVADLAGVEGAHRVVALGRVGRALAPLSLTRQHRCNRSHQYVKLLRK